MMNPMLTKVLLAVLALFFAGFLLASITESNKQPKLYTTGTRECLSYQTGVYCSEAEVGTVQFVSSLAEGDKICVSDHVKGWRTEYEVVSLPERHNDESRIISLMDSSGAVHDMSIHSIGLRERGDSPYGLPPDVYLPFPKGPFVYRYVCPFPN